MLSAMTLARLSCGGLFLTGLGTGMWKYRKMATSPRAEAPVYVDICHKAALMYAFACLVLAEFARLSTWAESVNFVAVALPIFFFVCAVMGYAIHGYFDDTDNQMRKPHRLGKRRLHPAAMNLFIYALAAGEIGGFLVLFTGYLRSPEVLAWPI